MKKLIVGLLVAGALIALLVLVRAFLHTPQTDEETTLVDLPLDEQAIAERLGACRT